MLSTVRLRLLPWEERHRDAFAGLHADPEVADDLGGPLSREASDGKFDRYARASAESGISRWALEDESGKFVGYSGVMFRSDQRHPLGVHYEVGWRLVRSVWGRGYAVESAARALNDAFARLGAKEIYSYTAETNLRSRAVMRKLGLRRDSSRDFAERYDEVGLWKGLVWVADRKAFVTS